jgi:hypothetical protein
MAAVDPCVRFAAQHLGGRPMPEDLCKLLKLQWSGLEAASPHRLIRACVTFLDGDRLPALIEAECRGRDDLGGPVRLAHAQAMTDMVRCSGFVGEQADGSALGYWFGPDRTAIEIAPLMRFDANGHFSLLRGHGIAEVILVAAAQGNERTFAELRQYLNQQGFGIAAVSVDDIRSADCLPLPQIFYQQLVRAYLADLSAASVPETGSPVTIMGTNRGPDIVPSD